MSKKTVKKKTKTLKIKKTKPLANGVSEEEFLEVLENISKRLGHKFKFGYHSYEDMKQQAAIFALEGLEKYDKSRPLENFLWTHVRNRLFNYKRDNYQRPDKPCLTCPFYDPSLKQSTNECTEYSDKNNCAPFVSWYNRNNSKKNIMTPTTMDEVNEFSANTKFSKKDSVVDFSLTKEIIEVLDEKIQKQYRKIYLRYKYGEKISSSDFKKLIKNIKQILKNHEQKNS